MTNRDFISNIRSTHRLLSGDGVINDRVIFSEMRLVGPTLIKSELNKRKLTATDTIYTTVPCLELEAVPISECCEYVDSREIARSKHKLPRIGESNYQYAIQGVFSIDQNKKLKEITPSRYINLLKLNNRIKEVYYWIQNNYLYITDPNVCKIKVVAYFEDDVPNSLLFSDCDCTTPNLEDECRNPLDKEFKFPGYLEYNLVQMVSAKLLNTYFKLPQDRQADKVDGQAANQIGK